MKKIDVLGTIQASSALMTQTVHPSIIANQMQGMTSEYALNHYKKETTVILIMNALQV